MHYRGPFANERGQHPPFDDCVAASAVSQVRAAGKDIPTNQTEIEALRTASGDSVGGQTLTSVSAGVKRRYGLTEHPITEWQGIFDAIMSNHWVIVRGDYDRLPAHYRRYQPGGTFSHAVLVGPNDTTSCWWVDPLEPQITHGESMPWATLKVFTASASFDAVSLPEAPGRAGHTVTLHGWFMRYFPGTRRPRLPWYTRGVGPLRVGATERIRYGGRWVTVVQIHAKGSAYDGWWVNIAGKGVDYQ